MSIDEKCVWLRASNGQREVEGVDSPGICSYKKNGCYDCDGLPDSACHVYTTMGTLTQAIINPDSYKHVRLKPEGE